MTVTPKCILHISGLVKYETSHQPDLDKEMFEIIMRDMGKNHGFLFDSITTYPYDPNLVGTPKLRIQVSSVCRGDKAALEDRLYRSFCPLGYDVDVDFLE